MAKQEQDIDSELGDLTFEQALNRLDETVVALEAGELNLSDATRLFEQGMKLARICSEMLATAELKISRIRTTYGEQMSMLGGDDGDQPGDGPC